MSYAIQITDASDKTNDVIEVRPNVNRFNVSIQDVADFSTAVSVTLTIPDAKILAEFILAEIKKMENNG